MSAPKKANGLVDVSHMMATWPQRFSEAVRRRAPSAKAAAELLGCCEGTAKRVLRGEPVGGDTLMFALLAIPGFWQELLAPANDLAREALLAPANDLAREALLASMMRQTMAEYERRLAA